MYCSLCGMQMPAVKMLCPGCQGFTPAFALNLYSFALWVVIVVINCVYLRVWLPAITALGIELPLPVHIYDALLRLAIAIAIGFLPLAIVVLFVLRWRKVAVPNPLKSGRLLAAATWMALVVSLLGIFSGLNAEFALMEKLAH